MSGNDDQGDYVWPAVVVGILAAVGAAVKWGPSALRSVVGSPPAAPLSRRREQVLQILHDLIPCAYPDAKYKAFSPGFQPESQEWRQRITDAGANPDTYSECGRLPGYILEQLHATGGGSKSGLEQLRVHGRAVGAWVEPGQGRRPRAGDLYAVSTDKGGIITHVGVIVSADGDTWQTADAGQGTRINQAVAFVNRAYDDDRGTLGPPDGMTAPPRYLTGWLDIDREPLEGEANA